MTTSKLSEIKARAELTKRRCSAEYGPCENCEPDSGKCTPVQTLWLISELEKRDKALEVAMKAVATLTATSAMCGKRDKCLQIDCASADGCYYRQTLISVNEILEGK